MTETMTNCPDCDAPVRVHCDDRHPSPTCDLLQCTNPSCNSFGTSDQRRWHRENKRGS